MSDNIQSCFERYEKKYRITQEQQMQIINGMQTHMQADKFGNYTICNIYYDTDDWQLVRASIEKPIYKEKLRVRSYGVPSEDGTVFVELKKKYDGVVYKRRITASPEAAQQLLSGEAPGENFGQIGREIEWFRARYAAKPKVFIGYDRMAFSGTEQPELRMTFDTGLRFRTDELDLRLGSHGAPLLPPGEVLMEIKIPGACPMWLSRLLSETGAFPTSFSKIGHCYKNSILRIGDALEKKEESDCA